MGKEVAKLNLKAVVLCAQAPRVACAPGRLLDICVVFMEIERSGVTRC